jgi:hypothetical protein
MPAYKAKAPVARWNTTSNPVSPAGNSPPIVGVTIVPGNETCVEQVARKCDPEDVHNDISVCDLEQVAANEQPDNSQSSY